MSLHCYSFEAIFKSFAPRGLKKKMHIFKFYPLTILYYLSFWLFFLQALEWIHDTGEFYLSTHTSTGSTIHHTQELLKEHEEFQITAKVCLNIGTFCFPIFLHACTLNIILLSIVIIYSLVYKPSFLLSLVTWFDILYKLYCNMLK